MIAIIDEVGKVLTRGKITADAAGFTDLLGLLAEAGDTHDDQIPGVIETDRSLLVAALRNIGRTVYPLNPLAASRYRPHHQVSDAKADGTDAVLLANILRTDTAAHRPLPADTELAKRSESCCWCNSTPLAAPPTTWNPRPATILNSTRTTW